MTVDISERRQSARAGVPLALVGGLPSRSITVPTIAAASRKATQSVVSQSTVTLEPSLVHALRPQTVRQWMLPYLSALTPQYIEMLLKSMLYGSHVAGMELFTVMIDTDPEIAACVQEYVEGVMDKKFQFEPYHEEDEEPSPLAVEKSKIVSIALRNLRPDMSRDENDLRNTVKDILFARFHGVSVLEADWNDTYGTGGRWIKTIPGIGRVQCLRSTYWVHPVCYALNAEYHLGLNGGLVNWRQATKDANKNKVGLDHYGFDGGTIQQPNIVVEFPPDKFLIGIHKAKTGSVLGGSCLRPLAWWWIASNFCGDWLLKYAELFGVPLRWAKLDAAAWGNEVTKNKIGEMLQNMGNSGVLMTPTGVEIVFEQARANSSESPQAFLFEFADRQKRKVILHQTMTGESNTSGKGYGVAEQDVKSDCIDSGARFAESVINLQLVPTILKLNYGEGGDLEAPMVKLVDVEVGNLADAQRDEILTRVMDVPSSYMHRRYGVPKPKAGEEIAGQDVGSAGAQMRLQQEQQEAQLQIQADAQAAYDEQQGQPLDKESGDKGTGTQAKAGLRATVRGTAKPHKLQTAGATPAPATILAASVAPLLARLKAIEAVEDSETRKALLAKFLKDHAQIKQAILADDSLAKALAAVKG